MRGKSAIVTHGRGGRIVFRGDELHFLKFEAQIVQRFLDQISVLVSHVAEFRGGHAHEKDRAAGMTVLGGLQPGVVGMAVDLFSSASRTRNHGLGERLGLGTDIINFSGAEARSAPGT